MKILIAEDDKVSALVLKRSLESLGHEVVVTSNGEEAWQCLEQQEIRLVISDWMMPFVDGLELCRRIRSRTHGHYVYFILLTARDLKHDRLRALSLGADDFLPKPLDRGELVARLTVAKRLLSLEEELRCRALELERIQGELEARNAQLHELATCDGLTGLRNRRYFREKLESNLHHQRPISIVMIDVDHFKSYNDTFGHVAGDEVLVSFANVLSQAVRDRDLVARYGGEEFVVLLPSADPHAGRRVAERIREDILGRDWPRRSITASLGVATRLYDELSATDLISLADQALYRAKAEGRNRVVHVRDLESAEVLSNF